MLISAKSSRVWVAEVEVIFANSRRPERKFGRASDNLAEGSALIKQLSLFLSRKKKAFSYNEVPSVGPRNRETSSFKREWYERRKKLAGERQKEKERKRGKTMSLLVTRCRGVFYI